MPEDDRYTIPGSGGVLRNKLGLMTQPDVDQAMNINATAEWSIMQAELIPDRLDLDYLRSIHRRFMDPVLDWAGELRLVGDEVGAGGTPFQYAASQFYKPELDRLMAELVSEDYLRGLSAEEFVGRLADMWGTLSFCRPFRDGNTRSQSAYVDRLAVRAGHPIDWQRVEVSALREARLSAAFRVGGEKVLADYLRAHLIERSGAGSQFGTGLAFDRGELGSVRSLRDDTRARISDGIAEHALLHRASFPTAPTPGAEHSTEARRSTPPAQDRHRGRGR